MHSSSPPIQHSPVINYSSLSSLQSVVKDQSTINTYLRVIKQHPHEFAQKIVMHLTDDCNCLYSIFIAQAGAKKVYCVLNGHSEREIKNKFMIQEILKQNKCDDIVEVRLFKDLKAQDKVDVIVGQPMGVNLIFDGMMERMIDARDMFLNEHGLLVPDRIRYRCAFVWDDYQKDQKVQFWNQVYGVSMTEMKKWVAQEPIIQTIDPTLIISHNTTLFQFNLYRATYQDIDNIRKVVYIEPLSKQKVKANGLAIWFQVQFKQNDGEVIKLDSSPWCEQTRWTHAALYTKGEWAIEGKTKVLFSAKKNNFSGNVAIAVEVGDSKQVYVIP